MVNPIVRPIPMLPGSMRSIRLPTEVSPMKAPSSLRNSSHQQKISKTPLARTPLATCFQVRISWESEPSSPLPVDPWEIQMELPVARPLARLGTYPHPKIPFCRLLLKIHRHHSRRQAIPIKRLRTALLGQPPGMSLAMMGHREHRDRS